MLRWWRNRKEAREQRPGLLARWRLRLRRILVITLLVVVLGPPLLVLVYRSVPPPFTLLMLVRMTEGHGIRKKWVPMRHISPHVPDAVIALEDNLYCEHNGFDWEAISEARAYNARPGARLRGASTVSQQTAKNVFLWPSRTMTRKAAEVPLTWMIETVWGKWRIMEVYLNVVEWGPGIYGVEAAARHHFGKSARNLTRHEAALLAAALPRPLRWNPKHPTPRLANRADRAMLRAVQLGELVDCVHPDVGGGKPRTTTRKVRRPLPVVTTGVEPGLEGAGAEDMTDAVLEKAWDPVEDAPPEAAGETAGEAAGDTATESQPAEPSAAAPTPADQTPTSPPPAGP